LDPGEQKELIGTKCTVLFGSFLGHKKATGFKTIVMLSLDRY